MSRWFRHYAGMMRDDKLVRVALKAKQPIERVVWVWGAILESAAEIDDGGRYEIDHAEMAWFLRVDEGDILAVENALRSLDRVNEGYVSHWKDRQFHSDRSAERQRRHRDRKKGDSDDQEDAAPPSGVAVTTPSPSRHGDAPETETETETEKKSSLRSDTPALREASPREELERVLDAEHAAAVVAHRTRLRKPLTAYAAKLLARDLAKTNDPNGAADEMISRSWTGFKPEWVDRRGRGPPEPPRNAFFALLSPESPDAKRSSPPAETQPAAPCGPETPSLDFEPDPLHPGRWEAVRTGV